MTLTHRCVSWLLAVAIVHCDSNRAFDGSVDANAGRDVGRIDASLPSTPSGVTDTMCARIVDLNAMGTLSGETVTIAGSTANPLEVMDGPCNRALTGHQLYSYRVRGEQVWLHATTNVPGGTPFLDTTLWVLDGVCSDHATVLACNDTDYTADGSLAGTATVVTRSLARGTELVFVVAGYAPARRGAVARGNFFLAVTEHPSARPGTDCNATVPGGCVPGYECAANSPDQGVCVQPIEEREPNDQPATASPVHTLHRALVIHAAIEPAGDIDCFAFYVTDNSNLWIEANDGGGSCNADLRAELFRAGRTEPIEVDDDSGRATDVACPLMSPTDHAGVRSMSEGTYVLCVRGSEPPDAPAIRTSRYSVQISLARP